QKLCEQQADKPLIEAALEKVFESVDDDKNLRDSIEKLRNKKVDDEKIIKKLIAKGFRYAEIKAGLDEIKAVLDEISRD
ncbi:MAG: RecX family transcriptional regulator, partial [Planctomycetes bacterium]|nr:RecX family transcriptional regulator [Planctomycetota bacterium]